MDDFINWDLLRMCCKPFGVELNDSAVSRFNTYAQGLVEYNKHTNLTRIVDPDEIVIRHFVDSLALYKFLPIKEGMEVCDVGTGAGFPGLALLIANPKIKLTMIDSTNKKLEFVRAMTRELLLDAEIITERAEEAGKNTFFRDRYDIVTGRAVAQLNILAEYSVPLCKAHGNFAPLKAVLSEEEKTRGTKAAQILGGILRGDYNYQLPDGSRREVMVFEKIRPTPDKYPRNGSQISKKPL